MMNQNQPLDLFADEVKQEAPLDLFADESNATPQNEPTFIQKMGKRALDTPVWIPGSPMVMTPGMWKSTVAGVYNQIPQAIKGLSGLASGVEYQPVEKKEDVTAALMPWNIRGFNVGKAEKTMKDVGKVIPEWTPDVGRSGEFAEKVQSLPLKALGAASEKVFEKTGSPAAATAATVVPLGALMLFGPKTVKTIKTKIVNSTAWRRATIPQRSVIIQDLNDLLKNPNINMTEAEIVKRYGGKYMEQAIERRIKGESSSIFEDIEQKPSKPVTVPPQQTGPEGQLIDKRISSELLPTAPIETPIRNIPQAPRPIIGPQGKFVQGTGKVERPYPGQERLPSPIKELPAPTQPPTAPSGAPIPQPSPFWMKPGKQDTLIPEKSITIWDEANNPYAERKPVIGAKTKEAAIADELAKKVDKYPVIGPEDKINGITVKQANEMILKGDAKVIPHIRAGIEKLGQPAMQDAIRNLKGVKLPNRKISLEAQKNMDMLGINKMLSQPTISKIVDKMLVGDVESIELIKNAVAENGEKYVRKTLGEKARERISSATPEQQLVFSQNFSKLRPQLDLALKEPVKKPFSVQETVTAVNLKHPDLDIEYSGIQELPKGQKGYLFKVGKGNSNFTIPENEYTFENVENTALDIAKGFERKLEAKLPVIGPKAKNVPVVEQVSAKEKSVTPVNEKSILSLKEQKKYLIDAIDEAIKLAPEAEGFVSKGEGVNAIDAYKINKEKFGTIKIEIPGDGTFNVLNTKQSLENLKKNAHYFPTSSYVKKGTKESLPKPSNKRIEGEGEVYYYNEYRTRKQSPIIQEKGLNDYYDKKLGWYSNGRYAIKTEKPNFEIKQQDFSDIIPYKNNIPAKINGEYYIGLGTPAVDLIDESGNHISLNAKYVDAILSKFPNSNIYTDKENPFNNPVLFKSGKDPVGVIMPIKVDKLELKPFEERIAELSQPSQPKTGVTVPESKKIIKPEDIEKQKPTKTRKPSKPDQKGIELYSGIPVHLIPEMIGDGIRLLKKMNIGLKSEDLNIIDRVLQTPLWQSKFHPKIKPIQDVLMMRQHMFELNRNAYLDNLLEDWRKLSKSETKNVGKILTKGDKIRKVLGKKGLAKLNPAERKAYESTREVLDYIIDEDIPNTYKILGQPDTAINALRQEIRKIVGFMPHGRRGRYHVKSQEVIPATGEITDKVLYREHFDDLLMTLTGGKLGYKAPFKLAKTKSDFPDALTTIGKNVKDLSEEAYMDASPEVTQELINAAMSHMPGDPAAIAAFQTAIEKAVADVFKVRGFMSHGKKRYDVPGWDEVHWQENVLDFVNQWSGFKSKMLASKKLWEVWPKIDWKDTPQLREWARKQVQDSFSNQTQIDFAVDKFRSLIFLNYLGGVVKSAVIQPLQALYATGPRLTVDTNWALSKVSAEMAKSGADIIKSIYTKAKPGLNKYEAAKAGRLDAEELRGLTRARNNGVVGNQNTDEMMGKMHFKYGGVPYKLEGALHFMFSVAERFGREVSYVTAYRVAKSKKMNFEQAAAYAENIVEESFGQFSKFNLPNWARGPIGKYARPMYSMRGAPTQLILGLYRHLGTRQGIRGKWGLVKAFLTLGALGGLTSLPFYEDMEKLFYKMTGKNARSEVKENMNDWYNLIGYGAAGAIGTDISGSIGTGLPSNIGELVGIPYDVYKRTMQSKEDILTKDYQRLAEDLPFMPNLARNVLQARRLGDRGMETRSGKDITDDDFEQIKLTPTEQIQKSAGFQPVKISESYRVQEFKRYAEKDWQDKRNRLLTAYDRAVEDKDNEKRVKILSEIAKFNKDRLVSIPPITAKSLAKKASDRPTRREIIGKRLFN